ncbi:MAG: radical SAM protein [Clostridia bacterium]|nr:radical SAM protein [Clostridia bacterium]
MKISKQDALLWYSFFAESAYDGGLEEGLSPRQREIALSVLSQIERAVDAGHRERMARIPGLKSLSDRTMYVGDTAHFPKGCKSCLFGTGLSAVRRTNRCNIQCPFCYNYGELDMQEPIGEGYFEIGGSRYRVEDLPLLFSIQGKPTGVAYVYLEPFMEIEKYEEIIRVFHEAGVYQHMYTNGTLATEENLRMLGAAGLDELRFNLGASNASDRVIEMMGIAKRFIPMVGIETPMTPAFFQQFHEKKEAIFAAKPDFMNCAELHLNPNNLENYLGENMYMARMGYLSPISSRNLTLELMREAGEENWPLVVHDCSNRTKFTRDLHLAKQEGGWFGKSGYASEFDEIPFEAFLPVLQDPDFRFLEEEELPKGYRFEDIVI